MSDSNNRPKEYVIQGITNSGKTFRPSDWSERLCGVMSCYRPGGVRYGANLHLGYSPYVRPIMIGGTKCVAIDERLSEIEPMALEFLFNFARDNDLPITDLCLLPDPPKK